MKTILFDDVIITSTDLKNNQKKWLDAALKSPVSVTNRGGKQYVLINRDQIHDLIQGKDYAEKIIKYCRELTSQMESASFISEVFPWAGNLTPEDRNAFKDEMVSTFTTAMQSNNWPELDEVIISWEATAEALSNRQFMQIVNSEARQREFTKVEG
jgi:hypothetical protein